MNVKAALASLFLGCIATTTSAASPTLFVAENDWICPSAPGMLTYATDAERKGAQCLQALLMPSAAVVLDAEFPVVYVCTELRSGGSVMRFNGVAYPSSRWIICGYALHTSIRDAKGATMSFFDIEAAAARGSFADVHKLPTVRYVPH